MNVKKTVVIAMLFLGFVFISCSSGGAAKDSVVEKNPDVEIPEDADAPTATWKEHWFEHNQLLSRVYYDDDLALYYDNDVDRNIEWTRKLLSEVWVYIKSVYGEYGEDPRLFAILHTDKYSGGHPSVYMDASHDYRNVVDCGPYNWTQPDPEAGLSMVIHEIGHIVEGSTNGIKSNPAWDIWKDSKWAEIFIYDVYKGIGRDDFAQQTYDDMVNKYDDFPRANTQWFIDWFYPIYSEHGGSKVLNNFYDLLAENFPKTSDGKAFSRRMNMGEFVHFWSGAAGVDLQPLAQEAFGWSSEWGSQLESAKETFVGINY